VKSEKKGKILKVEEKVTIEECEGETYNLMKVHYSSRKRRKDFEKIKQSGIYQEYLTPFLFQADRR